MVHGTSVFFVVFSFAVFRLVFGWLLLFSGLCLFLLSFQEERVEVRFLKERLFGS